MPIWHQSPKLTPRYFLETPRLFGYPFNTTWQSNHPLPFGNEPFCCEHPLLKLP